MILEGIVTTESARGEINIAPMGPHVDAEMKQLILRPFCTAQTFRNLGEHGHGVFHVTDDVLLLARTALGVLEPVPPLMPARTVRGHILPNVCRFYEFTVREIDAREERARIIVDVIHSEHVRDFFGFNRAKHAVVEAAILATRTDFLPLAEIEEQFRRFETIVRKTGGDKEKTAFAFLSAHVEQVRCKRGQTSS